MRHFNVLLAAAVLSWSAFSFASPGFVAMGTPTSVSTFESIGITCPFTGDDNFNSECKVEYKVAGTSDWKKGHSLYTCKKKRQHRGSLVHLTPGTNYEIKLTVTDRDGGTATKPMAATTWKESFPEGEKTIITNQTSGLIITKSGTPTAYRVYEGPAGAKGLIDLGKKVKDGIVVKANYIIVRRLKVKSPSQNGIRIMSGFNDIVIDDCEITDFGPPTAPGTFYYSVASGVLCYDGGHKSKRIVIQNCRIYNPTSRANSWEELSPISGYHPMGPQGISLMATGGNNVIRYNHIYSTKGQCYNDGIGTEGRDTWSDSDLYGNIVSYVFDDGLEMEAHNSNLRVWGNAIHHTNMGIATRLHNKKGPDGKVIGEGDPQLGPVYVWRNVFLDQWQVKGKSVGHTLKMRGDPGYYFYNNTTMRYPGSGKTSKYVTNTDWTDNFIAKNNIMVAEHPVIWLHRNYWTGKSTFGSFLNYNMYEKPRSGVQVKTGWEGNGIFSTTAQYDKVGEYGYLLKPGTKGVDAGEKIPNFCDAFTGAGPDIGACEKGVFEMKVGPHQGTIGIKDRNFSMNPNPRSFGRINRGPIRVFNIQGQLISILQSGRHSISGLQHRSGAGVFFLVPESERYGEVIRRLAVR